MIEFLNVIKELLPVIGAFIGVAAAAYAGVITAKTKAKQKVYDERLSSLERSLETEKENNIRLEKMLELHTKEIDRLTNRIKDYENDISRKENIIKDLQSLIKKAS